MHCERPTLQKCNGSESYQTDFLPGRSLGGIDANADGILSSDYRAITVNTSQEHLLNALS